MRQTHMRLSFKYLATFHESYGFNVKKNSNLDLNITVKI